MVGVRLGLGKGWVGLWLGAYLLLVKYLRLVLFGLSHLLRIGIAVLYVA